MKINPQTARKARIEMLPLIDIVFLLLVFFIYAMLSMAVHHGLPLILPLSTAAKIEKRIVLSVSIRADGSVYVDKERISGGQLLEALRAKAGSTREAGVLLFDDKNLPYQKLFHVLDQIRLAGLNRISLQAEVDRRQ